MKKILQKIGFALLTALSGFALGLLALLGLQQKGRTTVQGVDDDEIEQKADEVRLSTKERILRSSRTSLSEQYECTGESIAKGQKRFNERVRTLLQSKRGG